jgi:hypothetical protein
MENEEFIHIVKDLQNKLENEDVELIAVVARNLWFRRNSVIREEIFSHPTQIVRKASESLNALKNANARPHERREGGHILNTK